MSNPFDELTLGEVEQLTAECLGGKSFEDSSPLTIAGAVMYAHEKRKGIGIGWEEFKSKTSMGDIKAFSALMNEDDAENPTIAPQGQT